MNRYFSKNPLTQELVDELDKELQSINFPRVTFVPTDREKREKELEAMMYRNKPE